MENAQRGGLLDFSSVLPLERPLRLQMDAAKLNLLRQELKARVKQLGLSRAGIHVPAVDIDSERAWTDDERPIDLPIGARIKL
jgi:hypothetical protein